MSAEALTIESLGDLVEAKDHFAREKSWINLSVLLANEGQYDYALRVALRAVEADPLKAYVQAMKICWETGDREGVDKYVQLGLAVDPDNIDLRIARGTFRLAEDPYDKAAWDDVELRPWANKVRAACDEVEEWDGKKPIEGKSLLVLYQDGHGDRVMYSRFLRNIWEERKPARIVLYVTYDTARLFAESFPFCDVVSTTEQFGDVDTWIGLSSLGKIGFPISGEPYLTVPEERERKFAGYFENNGHLRVGLVWAGNAKHTLNHTRSKPFSFFEPLLDIPGIDFYSLQFEEHNLDHGGKLRELSIYCRDTADTLTAIKNLDLVIGVDTGMIHFAGAIGVPAWCCCFAPVDWRWGADGSQSYWYDSVRIWRNDLHPEIALTLYRNWLLRNRTEHVTAERPPSIINGAGRYGELEIFTHDLWTGRAYEEYGEWSEGEMDVIRQVVRPESVVIEAGANVGTHTVGISRRAKHVMAFEPQKEVFDILLRNITRNGCKNVSLIEAALADRMGTTRYTPANVESVCEPGSVSLRGGNRECAALTIDSLDLKRLDLIKADVEGMETHLLEGARETIARCRPVLYLEANEAADREPLYRLCDSFGYRLHLHTIPLFNPDNFRGNKLNIFGALTSTMLFCVPRERYDLRDVTRGMQRVRFSN